MDESMINEIQSELVRQGKEIKPDPELVAKLQAAFCKLAEGLKETIKRISAYMAEKSKQLVDVLFYVMNDNPKWWHLYKYAKKARTRKKYRHLLMKQLRARYQLEK